MYDVFFQKFNEKISLTEQEENFIKQYLTPKKLRKRQYLLQEGDICKSIALLEKVSMWSYLVDSTGQEHITALEGCGRLVICPASVILSHIPYRDHCINSFYCRKLLLSNLMPIQLSFGQLNLV